MKPPVFVLGAPRSGTTLLYHMLCSSGQFAVYMAETHVFNLVGPRFGNLADRVNRQKLLDVWLQSFQFNRSGLNRERFAERVMKDCRTEGEFLRIFMEQISEQQGLDRWAECTPEHLLYLKQIKRALPDAKIIHIIRDGRDVALSEMQQNWVRPLPWDRNHRLQVSGLYWEWIVRRGREDGQKIAPDYMEVRFEELVENPREVLPGISSFIGQSLDYETMLASAVGSLKRPNTSFADDSKNQGFHPVGRWKNKLAPEELSSLEAAIGPFLKELGYPLVSQSSRRRVGAGFTTMRLRASYASYFDCKLWLKSHTPLGRLTTTGLLHEGQPSKVMRETTSTIQQ
jgi:hypothetical protein